MTRRRFMWITASVVTTALTLVLTVYVLPATSQPSNFLELDNNIRSNGSLDWGLSNGFTGTNGVFNNGGPLVNQTTTPAAPTRVATASSIIDTAFKVDPLASDNVNGTSCGPGDPTVFTDTGGEKNGDRIDTMTYSTGSVPPKDEISNVYALSHDLGAGNSEIFFGAERIVNNGDSHIDFEFLHSPISKTGTCSGSFGGHRSQGDALLAVDFTNGGELGETQLYLWHCVAEGAQQPVDGTVCDPPANGPSVPHYQPVANNGTYVFGVNGGGDVLCGGWICRGQFGESISSVPQNAFMEGGINLGDAGITGCISTFLPHTRSSQSFTATLKDFVTPIPFNSCFPPDIQTTSQPGGTVVPGAPVADLADLTGNNPIPAGTIDFYLCNPSQVTAAGCPVNTGTKIGATKTLVNGLATSDPTTATTTEGKYCWRAYYTPSATAHYSAGSHSNATSECFTVAKVNATIVTDASPSGTGVVPGTSVHDTTTLTGAAGTPTGTVDFYLCGPSQVTAAGCPAGSGTFVSTETLSGGSATSDSTNATTAEGTYCWRVHYDGNSVYNAGDHTNALLTGTHPECFSVAKLTPAIVTDASPSGSGVIPGTSVTDTVTVSGAGGTPTGTVSFYLCSPAQVTAAGCPNGSGTLVSTETLSGGTATSDATSATTAEGKYCWRVHYNGDTVYNAGDHTNALLTGTHPECFSVARIAPTIVTDANPSGGNVVPGSPVTDTATVSGTAGTPTGTVDFYLCSPSQITVAGCPIGAGTFVSTETLSGGTATSDATTATTTEGTYCWRVHYNGDTVYLPGDHTNGNTTGTHAECFTVVRVNPSIVTDASPSGDNVVPGTLATDTATLSGTAGTPTGSVSFYLCGPTEVTGAGCPAGSGTFVSTETLSGGTATSDPTNATTAEGKYCWRVHYNGDTVYNPGDHSNANTTGDHPECFIVNKQTPSIVTDSDPSGDNVVPGTSATDTVVVSGSAGTPTGTVSFYLCGPSEVDSTGCPSNAGTLVSTETLALGTATSDATTDTRDIGTYCWRVAYSGDVVYDPAEHTNASTTGDHPECFEVEKQPSETETTSNPNGTTIVPGSTVSDTATVSGLEGETPTGTVAFFLCTPSEVDATGCPSDKGTQVGDEVELVDGSATSESTNATTAVGTYCWRASYSGDDFYLPSDHTNATTECFTTAKVSPSITTNQIPVGGGPGIAIHDTATVTGGSNPTGTVTFKLYPPSDSTCSGTPVYTDTVPLVNGQAESGEFAATELGIYRWVAVYNGDTANNTAVSGCQDELVSIVAGRRLVKTGNDLTDPLIIGILFLLFGAALWWIPGRRDEEDGEPSA